MPLPALPAAAGPLAKAASKVLPYAYKWAPYYAVKFGVLYGIKRYPGGTPGLYRTSLRVVRRRFPPGPGGIEIERHARLVGLVRQAFRVPGHAEAALVGLDGAMADLVREDARTRREEGVPEEFVELLERLHQKQAILRCLEVQEREEATAAMAAERAATAERAEAAAAKAAAVPDHMRKHYQVLVTQRKLDELAARRKLRQPQPQQQAPRPQPQAQGTVLPATREPLVARLRRQAEEEAARVTAAGRGSGRGGGGGGGAGQVVWGR